MSVMPSNFFALFLSKGGRPRLGCYSLFPGSDTSFYDSPDAQSRSEARRLHPIWDSVMWSASQFNRANLCLLIIIHSNFAINCSELITMHMKSILMRWNGRTDDAQHSIEGDEHILCFFLFFAFFISHIELINSTVWIFWFYSFATLFCRGRAQISAKEYVNPLDCI